MSNATQVTTKCPSWCTDHLIDDGPPGEHRSAPITDSPFGPIRIVATEWAEPVMYVHEDRSDGVFDAETARAYASAILAAAERLDEITAEVA